MIKENALLKINYIILEIHLICEANLKKKKQQQQQQPRIFFMLRKKL